MITSLWRKDIDLWAVIKCGPSPSHSHDLLRGTSPTLLLHSWHGRSTVWGPCYCCAWFRRSSTCLGKKFNPGYIAELISRFHVHLGSIRSRTRGRIARRANQYHTAWRDIYFFSRWKFLLDACVSGLFHTFSVSQCPSVGVLKPTYADILQNVFVRYADALLPSSDPLWWGKHGPSFFCCLPS